MSTLDPDIDRAAEQAAISPLLATTSLAQRRLWLVNKLTPGSPLFNVAHGIRLRGVLDPDRLHRAIIGVAQRHETLRMYFIDDRTGSVAEPSACILPTPVTELPLTDLSHLSPAQLQEQVNHLAIDFARQPFHLATGPLFRTRLFRLGPEEHLLVFVVHHISSDRWSVDILLRELAAYYADSRSQPSLEPIIFTYSNFADWQLKRQSGPAASEHLQYWCNLLTGAPPFLDLPADHVRPASSNFEGTVLATSIDPELTAKIKNIGMAHAATPYMTFLTAFLVLLNRITHQADLVIGTPVAGRGLLEAERLIGLFVNILPVRAKLQRDKSFSENLRAVRSSILDSLAHQETPFEQIVEAVYRERDQSRHPLFDVVFNFHNVPAPVPWTGELKADLREIRVGVAHFDLTLTLRPKPGGGMVCEFEYSRELFESSTIDRLARHFLNILEGIAADPNCIIAQLPLLDPEERKMILEQWSGVSSATSSIKQCVHELFEQQAARTPDRHALVCGHDRLTYAQLNSRVNQLAWRLRAAGVGPDARVAICLPRTLELPIAILAVLKAGGAYVPLDPAYPQLRLNHMLEIAQPVVLLTHSDIAGRFAPNPDRALICMDHPADAQVQRDGNPPNIAELSNLAYIIFTSGSTGQPKGVAIEHRGLAALIDWAKHTFDDEESAGMLFSSSVCFDFSVFELFASLTRGAKLVIVPNVLELPDAPAAQEVTLLTTVPSAMAELIRMNRLPVSIRSIALGGETLPAPLVQRCTELPGIHAVYNLYGPTEDSVCSTHFRVPTKSTMAPAIGRPVAGTSAYILDANMQPVPIGTSGELFVGGSKLARCYLHRPDLTTERFVSNPFQSGERLYRTGDLCRWSANGFIHYLGRIDQQVKLRGFRIELGEIESALSSHAGVRQCRAIVRGDAADQQLIAYIVAADQEPPSSQELRDFLGNQLPAYMIPAAFVTLHAMPLTPNGKVDTSALPAPTRDNMLASHAPRTALKGDVQLALGRIWCEVLGVTHVGPEDNFFALGGHSLLLVMVSARVHKALGIDLPLRHYFEHPTIAEFARMLSDRLAHPSEPTAIEQLIVPLRSTGTFRPLFCIPGAGGHPFTFGLLIPFLNPAQPVYGLQFPGLEMHAEVLTSIEAIAEVFVSEIRQFQPQGPYRLAGYSLGSTVAFEMAQQLHAQGQIVELLAFFDGLAPDTSRPRPFWQKLLIHGRRMFRKHPRAAMNYAFDRVRGFAGPLPGVQPGDPVSKPSIDDSAANAAIRRVQNAAEAAGRKYRPRHYSGSVTLFQSTEHAEWADFYVKLPANGWGQFIDHLQIHPVPGTHWTMFNKPHLPALADEFNRCLASLAS